MKYPIDGPEKNPHAVALGKIGGKAGVGLSKRRGDNGYYKRLSDLATLKRKKEKTHES